MVMPSTPHLSYPVPSMEGFLKCFTGMVGLTTIKTIYHYLPILICSWYIHRAGEMFALPLNVADDSGQDVMNETVFIYSHFQVG